MKSGMSNPESVNRRAHWMRLIKMEHIEGREPRGAGSGPVGKTYGTLVPRVYADYDFGFTKQDVIKAAKDAQATGH